MTPKQKAEELVDIYYNKSELLFEVLSFIQAKECALIAVDEILFALKYDMNEPTSGSIKYWKQVKQEIELLW